MVNIEKAGGTEQIVLADMTENTDRTVNWGIAPGAVDVPTSLPINFDGSWISPMTAGWPGVEADIFKLMYTLAPIKQ